MYINVISYTLISSRWCLPFMFLYVAFLCIYLLQHAWSSPTHFNTYDFIFLMLLIALSFTKLIWLCVCHSVIRLVNKMRGFHVLERNSVEKTMENNLFLNFAIMTFKPTNFRQIFKSEHFFIIKNFHTSKAVALPVQFMQDLIYLGFRAIGRTYSTHLYGKQFGSLQLPV